MEHPPPLHRVGDSEGIDRTPHAACKGADSWTDQSDGSTVESQRHRPPIAVRSAPIERARASFIAHPREGARLSGGRAGTESKTPAKPHRHANYGLERWSGDAARVA